MGDIVSIEAQRQSNENHNGKGYKSDAVVNRRDKRKQEHPEDRIVCQPD